jgi:RNA polymerase sigma-70 factor, ECF subfamily
MTRGEPRRLVILGPPASGKGTQGELLAKELDIPHISTGQLLRWSIEEEDDPHGVRDTVAQGGRVSDEVIEELILPELGDRFLLDGYPRSPRQAERLDVLLAERRRPLDAAIELQLDDETLVVRMVLRADAEHRTDDHPDVFLRRLEDYNSDIAALRSHYDGRLVQVDGHGDVSEVLTRILEALNAPEASGGGDEEMALLEALRAGDESAFTDVVDRFGGSMLRLAVMWVGRRAVAEEVVQETWLGILRGLDRFEGRSSLKTWMFRILANTAKKRAAREGRMIPFLSLSDPSQEPAEPAVEPERFRGPRDGHPGGWISFPSSWEDVPAERLESRETMGAIGRAIQGLPPNQREVIRMRDVEGFSSREVCNVLGITETNQRVLLHRARSRVRRAVERHLDRSNPPEGTPG